MKFNIKNFIGLILIIAGTVVGILTKTSVSTIGAIVSIAVGATLAIANEMQNTNLKGWKKWLFLVTIVGGSICLSLGGYSDTVIMEVVGAVVLVGSIIFGILVNKKENPKIEEKTE